MKTYHFFDNSIEILHRMQELSYQVNDTLRLKGRNGTVISIQMIDEKNTRVNVKLEPKKTRHLLIDLKKLRRR